MFSEIKSLFKHSSIYAFAAILQKAIGFIMIPVYTRYLTPADYGLIELLDLTLYVSIMLIGMRFGGALIRFYHHYDNIEDKEEVFTTALIFTFGLSIFVLITLEIFSPFLAESISGNRENTFYFQLIFLCIAFRGLSLVPESYLLAQKKSFIYSCFSVGVLTTSLSLNIYFLVFLQLGVMGIVLSMVITKFLNGFGVMAFTLKGVKLRFSMVKLKKMVAFGLPLVPASFAMFVMHFSDRFFIQRFCSLDELGLYSLGYKFGMLISVLISQPFFNTWNTQRFEIAKNRDAPQLFGRFFSYYFILILFAALGISIFINDIIEILATSKYMGASSFVPLIVFSYILFGLGNFFTLGIMITYKTVYLTYIHLFVAMVNIIANYILIQIFGVWGAAFATIVTFFLLAGISAIVSQKLYHINIEYSRLLVLSTITGTTFWLSTFIDFPLVYSIASKIILFIIFIMTLYFIGFFKEDEIKKITELTKNIPVLKKMVCQN